MEVKKEKDQSWNLFNFQQQPTMSFSTIDVCKKRKRRQKIFRLQSFADSGCPIAPSGSFRENVRLFLQEAAELEDYTVMGNPLWCTFLNHDKTNLMAPFYTLEEDVYNSSHPFCDHCRCVGSFSSSDFYFLGFVLLVILELGLFSFALILICLFVF
jgi:hypothetical protein